MGGIQSGRPTAGAFSLCATIRKLIAPTPTGGGFKGSRPRTPLERRQAACCYGRGTPGRTVDLRAQARKVRPLPWRNICLLCRLLQRRSVDGVCLLPRGLAVAEQDRRQGEEATYVATHGGDESAVGARRKVDCVHVP